MPSWDRKTPDFQPPAPHPTRPANPPMIFLIGPPVIRIRPKSFVFINNSSPNRHKARPHPIQHLATSQRRPLPGLLSLFSFLFSPSRPLIGPPVSRLLIEAQRKMDLIATVAIRIRPKPPRINHLKISNRHKTHASLSSTSAPSVLATNHSPLTTRLLIATPAIRISRNSHQINNIAFSNRHKTHPAALATQPSPLATEPS